MKILVVAQDFPWPPTYGSRLRLVQVLEVAASLGDTDLFSFVMGKWDDPLTLPEGLNLRRFETTPSILNLYTRKTQLRFVSSRGMPLEAVSALETADARETFYKWADRSYDVVWFSKAMTYHLLGRPSLGPTIVDLDDLEDRKIAARVAAMRVDRGENGLFRHAGVMSQATLNAHKWKTFQKKIARSVDWVALCSDLDVGRFRSRNAVIVPNGFDAPATPAGRIEVSRPPTILLQGSLRYGPNADAANWLVKAIIPHIRTRIPDVQVRLVGDPDGTVEKLHDPPAVTVAGRVPSMDPELALADIVAVPLRYGSGTRVKILESFANRIPVVSTTIGAEGLHVEAGRHLLIADDPVSFADACVRLLQEPELRATVAEFAHQEFLERHQWTVARDRIRALLLEAAGPLTLDSGMSRTTTRPIPANRVGFLVVGSARSGTTLIQRLACEIEGVVMPPETHFFTDFAWELCFRRIFPIGAPELREELDRFLARETSAGLDLDVHQLIKDLGGTCASILDLFDAIVLHLAGKAEVWGEKTPGHLWWWAPIAEAAPWMRFVVTVRDPRAVVSSTLSMPWAKDGDGASWGDQLHLSMASRWAFEQEVVSAMSDSLGPSRCLILRYEDVVTDPHRARLQIARLIGREDGVTYKAAPDSLVLPWESWKLRALGDVTTDRVATWHHDLEASQARDIAAICRVSMEKFGYTDQRPGVLSAELRQQRFGKETRAKLEEELDSWRDFQNMIERIDDL